jgi:hypothetical protein
MNRTRWLALSEIRILQQLTVRNYNIGRNANGKVAISCNRVGLYAGAALCRGAEAIKQEVVILHTAGTKKITSESLSSTCLIPKATNEHLPVG